MGQVLQMGVHVNFAFVSFQLVKIPVLEIIIYNEIQVFVYSSHISQLVQGRQWEHQNSEICSKLTTETPKQRQ